MALMEEQHEARLAERIEEEKQGAEAAARRVCAGLAEEKSKVEDQLQEYMEESPSPSLSLSLSPSPSPSLSLSLSVSLS